MWARPTARQQSCATSSDDAALDQERQLSGGATSGVLGVVSGDPGRESRQPLLSGRLRNQFDGIFGFELLRSRGKPGHDPFGNIGPKTGVGRARTLLPAEDS